MVIKLLTVLLHVMPFSFTDFLTMCDDFCVGEQLKYKQCERQSCQVPGLFSNICFG